MCSKATCGRAEGTPTKRRTFVRGVKSHERIRGCLPFPDASVPRASPILKSLIPPKTNARRLFGDRHNLTHHPFFPGRYHHHETTM